MNLALRDVRYRPGRFLLTALGLGLLLTTVMTMGGVYQGLVVEALSIIRASGADVWVVQKDTNGPFAETSRVPDDLYRVIRAVPGVREASPVAFQNLQFRIGAKAFRVQLIGYRLGGLGGPPAVVAGRSHIQSRYEMVIGEDAGLPVGTEIRIGRLVFRIVGLTEGIVSTSGDPVAFVSLLDAQEIQFSKASEAVRNDRARLEADLHDSPALAAVLVTRWRRSSRTRVWPTPSWSTWSQGAMRWRCRPTSSGGTTTERSPHLSRRRWSRRV